MCIRKWFGKREGHLDHAEGGLASGQDLAVPKVELISEVTWVGKRWRSGCRRGLGLWLLQTLLKKAEPPIAEIIITGLLWWLR